MYLNRVGELYFGRKLQTQQGFGDFISKFLSG
jgi:hypothetical protein